MADYNFRNEPLVMTYDIKLSHIVAALVTMSLGASLLPKFPMNLGQDCVDLVVVEQLNARIS